MKIWLDDVREPPDETWEWAASVTQFRHLLKRAYKSNVVIEVISFDHDLGFDRSTGHDGYTGYDCIKLCAEPSYPGVYPREVRVHSANPVGAEAIRQYDEWYRRMLQSEQEAR